MMQEKSFRLFELIMVANIAQKNLKRIVNIMGIRRELTTTYTPQQNGVSERKNRTILNMVRSLLTRGKLPTTFWPEAVNWSIHVSIEAQLFLFKT